MYSWSFDYFYRKDWYSRANKLIVQDHWEKDAIKSALRQTKRYDNLWKIASVWSRTWSRHQPGEPEVAEFDDPVVGHQNVLGFDVTMDDLEIYVRYCWCIFIEDVIHYILYNGRSRASCVMGNNDVGWGTNSYLCISDCQFITKTNFKLLPS